MIVGMSMDEFLTSVESREIDDLDESELFGCGYLLILVACRVQPRKHCTRMKISIIFWK